MKWKWGFLIGVILCCGGLFLGCASQKDKGEEQDTPKAEGGMEAGETKDPAEEETNGNSREAFVDQVIAEMTLEQKVGQLLMLCLRTDENGNPKTQMDADWQALLEKYQPGGIILFSENMEGEVQVQELTKDLQEYAQGQYQNLLEGSAMKLFIGVDEEGGRVSRLKSIGAPPVLSAQDIADTKDPAEALEAYKMIGMQLSRLNINVDFAPVADLNTNPDNTVIGDRAFGSDPEEAGRFVAQAVAGLQSESHDVSACLKHFPGHGDTREDSHTQMAYVEHSLERLLDVELAPFRAGIAQGADFVMVGHIKTPNATTDDLPASMSEDIVADLLRGELGYQGVVITDAMDMGAITAEYTSGEAALLALTAGVDIVLMPQDVEECYSYLLESAKSGALPETRMDEALRRILNLKFDKGLLSEASFPA